MEQCEPEQLCCGLGLTVDVTLESRVTNFMLLSDVELKSPVHHLDPLSAVLLPFKETAFFYQGERSGVQVYTDMGRCFFLARRRAWGEGGGGAVETILMLHPFSSSVLWGCSVKGFSAFILRVEWFEWLKGLGPGPVRERCCKERGLEAQSMS